MLLSWRLTVHILSPALAAVILEWHFKATCMLGPCLLMASLATSSENFLGSRHAFGDQYRATDLVIPGAGKLELVFHPRDGSKAQQYQVHEFDGAGWPLLSLASGAEYPQKPPTEFQPSSRNARAWWQAGPVFAGCRL